LRILILDALYREFLDTVYSAHPALDAAGSREQLATIYSYGFARCDFLATNLQRLGHEAKQVIVNAQPVQRAAARELGVPVPRRHGRWWQSVQRVSRGARRRLGREAPSLAGAEMRVVAAQIEQFDPDVIFNAEVLQFPASFLRRVKGRRQIIGECAYPIPDALDLTAYDRMVSAVPHFVSRFVAAGIPTALWPHAFDPSVLEHLGAPPPAEGVAFIGSVTRHHSQRRELLERVAERMPVRFFGNATGLPLRSPLRGRFQPPLWGYAMYREIQRARITLNIHINMASKYAANVRLYEATGMGTLLLTDWKENLHELFEISKEVVAFRSADECVGLAQHYLAHEQERAAIARAGQLRTLRDHTYLLRARRLVALIEGEGDACGTRSLT
jgi:spore maturation protein CgeB